MSRFRIVGSSVIVAAAAMLCVPTSASADQHARSRGGSAPRGHVVVRSAPARVVHVAPRVVRVAPYHFAQPYYAFRPRVSLGFGLFVGYPIRYPYFYGYPYAYPYPYPAYAYPPAPYAYPPPPASAYPPPPASSYPANGFPANGYPANGYPASSAPNNVNVQPGTVDGGVSFEITPIDAEIYVDGANVGRVSDFGPSSAPLTMTPGRHRIEVRRSGYQELVIDADVHVGEVVPYQGAMQPR
jgi:hypothetical protein